MSRFLLVVLEEDLAAHHQTRNGAFLLLKRVPGVESVTDFEIISQATLDVLLRKPEPPASRRKHQSRRL